MNQQEEQLAQDLSVLVDLGLVEMSFNEHFHPIYRITEKSRQMTQEEITALIASAEKE